MKKSVISIIFTIALVFGTFGQSKTFEDILSSKPKNFSPIMSDNEVKGYVMFQELDEVGTFDVAYRVSFFDYNLNEMSSTDFEEGKNLHYIHSVYNGNEIIIQFFDKDNDRIIFRKISTKGEKLSRESIKTESNWERLTYLAMVNPENAGTQGERKTAMMKPIMNRGFVNYGISKENRGSYQIRYYPDDESKKQWVLDSDPEEKGYLWASYLTQKDNLLVHSVSKRKGLLSSRIEYSIQVLDVNQGIELFNTSTNRKGFNVKPLNASIDPDTGNINVFGMYYDEGDKILKSASKGFATIKLNQEGEVIQESYTLWSDIIKEYLPNENAKKFGKDMYVYIHDVLSDSKGNIYVVGEKYKKSGSKIIIGDIMLFKMNNALKLTDVDIINKKEKEVDWPARGDVSKMGAFLDIEGKFDYKFYQHQKSSDDITIVLNESTENERKIGVVSILNGKVSHTTSKLSSDGNFVIIKNAKPGYATIWDYDIIEKIVEIRIEKLNY